MPLATLSTLLLGVSAEWFTEILRQGFYPILLSVFVIASLGVPLPEDIPLIAAGVILKTHPEIASWPLTIMVSLMGIMSGDIILYSLGRRWGPEVFSHRSVAWLITPRRLEVMTEKFHEYGMWMCFFGRFMVGVRAVMCLTAGVTRFPFWKFFVADFCGALLSAPFFIVLGYLFAHALDQVKGYVVHVQYFFIALVLIVGLVIWRYEVRRLKKQRAEDERYAAEKTVGGSAAQPLAGQLTSETQPSGKVPASRKADAVTP